MVRAGLQVFALVLVWAAAGAAADDVHLRGGGKLSGRTTRVGDQVYVETGSGTITLKASEVKRIDSRESPADAVARRREKLASDDVDGRVTLADYCQEHGLQAERRQLLEETVAIDPDHAGARERLGQVRYGDRWVDDTNLTSRTSMTRPHSRRSVGDPRPERGIIGAPRGPSNHGRRADSDQPPTVIYPYGVPHTSRTKRPPRRPDRPSDLGRDRRHRPSDFGRSPDRPSHLGRSPDRPSDLGRDRRHRPSDFGRSSDRPSHLGRSPDRPSDLGRSRDRPSHLGRSPDRPSALGRSSDRPSDLGRTSDRPSRLGRASDRPSELGRTRHRPSDLGRERGSRPSRLGRGSGPRPPR